MMKISVSWANKVYDETYSYAKARTVRHVSKLSVLNFLLNITISGVPEDEAFDALMTMVRRLGCDPELGCMSHRNAVPLSYDEANKSLSECLCIAKDLDGADMKLQKESLMKKARKIAWDIKYENRGLLPNAEYAYEVAV